MGGDRWDAPLKKRACLVARCATSTATLFVPCRDASEGYQCARRAMPRTKLKNSTTASTAGTALRWVEG